MSKIIVAFFHRSFFISCLIFLTFLIYGCQLMREDIPTKDHPREIERFILKYTPIGTNMLDVEKYCAEQKFEKCVSSHKFGFENRENAATPFYVGVKSVSARLGDYMQGKHFIISTIIHWGFDQNEKLIAIWVEKQVDGP